MHIFQLSLAVTFERGGANCGMWGDFHMISFVMVNKQSSSSLLFAIVLNERWTLDTCVILMCTRKVVVTRENAIRMFSCFHWGRCARGDFVEAL
mmetsp:Transcript_31541/g.84217  ORF Transcript_31541/g.84217 Transcript_31541/m.84217 type:complete len:94 (+) Transcript_31541:1080-1361(+)